MVKFETGMRKDMSVEQTIKAKLAERFKPEYLMVENESYKHKGHAGDNGSGESHFKVEIRAGELAELPRVKAHGLVYDCLQAEMQTAIHALSIKILR